MRNHLLIAKIARVHMYAWMHVIASGSAQLKTHWNKCKRTQCLRKWNQYYKTGLEFEVMESQHGFARLCTRELFDNVFELQVSQKSLSLASYGRSKYL